MDNGNIERSYISLFTRGNRVEERQNILTLLLTTRDQSNPYDTTMYHTKYFDSGMKQVIVCIFFLKLQTNFCKTTTQNVGEYPFN